MASAIVLLSGGLDSTVNLYETLQQHEVSCVLFFNYGQRAYAKEKQTVINLCQKHQLPVKEIDVNWLKNISASSLTNESLIPNSQTLDISSYEASLVSAKSVWVPNRNGLFLNVAACFAESLEANLIIPGFNLEEAKTFPDNSKDFLNITNEALKFSTQNQVQVKCYTIDLDKEHIVKRALELKIDLSQIWPCYHSNQTWCADCESCLRFKSACEKNEIDFEKLRQARGEI